MRQISRPIDPAMCGVTNTLGRTRKGRVRRQRLGIGHVEHGSQTSRRQLGEQRILVDERRTGGVDQGGTVAQQRQLRLADHAPRAGDVRRVDAQHVTPRAQLVELHELHTERGRLVRRQVGIGHTDLEVVGRQQVDDQPADHRRTDETDPFAEVADPARIERHRDPGVTFAGGEEERPLVGEQDGGHRVLGHRHSVGRRRGGDHDAAVPHGVGHLPLDGARGIGEQP